MSPWIAGGVKWPNLRTVGWFVPRSLVHSGLWIAEGKKWPDPYSCRWLCLRSSVRSCIDKSRSSARRVVGREKVSLLVRSFIRSFGSLGFLDASWVV